MKILVLILCLLSFSAVAETEFKIITLQHRFANDLLPIISPMVGENGTAAGIDNQLILRTSPERMREIEATVAKLDAAKANRKITVDTSDSMQTRQERTEASGKVKVGKVTVGNDRQAPANSGNVDIARNTRNTQKNSSQFINVLDGERAFIRVGQMVPFTQEWVTITRRYVQIERTLDWQEISTGFAVRPRTVGNQVELEVTPRIARLNQQGFIDFEELTTTLRVTLGDWVDIGATMQQNDEVSRKILGIQNESNRQNSRLSIKVD
ncbi:MAG TPA: secretin N-terminal domain-containing protein [Methylotenera sp.]|nr:secretin N-terminal domain-containing protein [Methylotenera sp.]HPV44954.1 secretin N-terminal domain-containing protein [Methylotenera sp.]